MDQGEAQGQAGSWEPGAGLGQRFGRLALLSDKLTGRQKRKKCEQQQILHYLPLPQHMRAMEVPSPARLARRSIGTKIGRVLPT